jgi:predicted nucleic acid-binding protein
MIVLDTNVLSEVLRTRPAPQVLAWLNDIPADKVFVSSVTQAEMLLGVALLPPGKRRNTLAAQVTSLFAQHFIARCLPFDALAAPHYARIVAGRQRTGRPMSTEDGQIAAITLSRSFRLATRNVADFVGIADLNIINPWENISS